MVTFKYNDFCLDSFWDLKLCTKHMAKITQKGPVKLIKWVKIAHSFLQFVSDQFHIIILSLPM